MNREGTFLAVITEHCLSTTKTNNLAQVAVKARIEYERADGEWTQLETPSEEVGYFGLEKSDGTLNTHNIDSLKESLGWDGHDFNALDDGRFVGAQVQAVFKYDNSEGYEGYKWRYLNNKDRAGGLRRLEDTERKSIADRLGPKLRAHNGGTPAATPRPTAPKPTAPRQNGTSLAPASAATPTAPKSAPTQARTPAPARPAAPKPSNGNGKTYTYESAWEAFWNEAIKIKSLDPATNPEAQTHIGNEFERLLAQRLGERSIDQATPDDWKYMATQAPGGIIPF